MKKVSNKEFILSTLKNMVVASDEELMNRHTSRYMKMCAIRWNWSAIIKWGETLKKVILQLKRDGVLIEEKRITRKKSTSIEVFYKLA